VTVSINGPRLRKDALRNRQLLLEAAREVFAEQGLGASLDEIARRAGVGNATLYRRFPTRESLYAAVFTPIAEALGALGDRVLGIEDAWTGLVAYAEGVCALTASDRGVCDLMMSGFSQPPSMAESIERTLRQLVDGVHRQGSIRPDITFVDVQAAILAVLLLIPAYMAVRPDAWRRHLSLTLDSLRPPERTPLPAASLTEDQFRRVTGHLFPALHPDTD
jgi:AcrR family transcriptional regulator